MAISFKCPNGHKLTTNESKAGKKGKCPVCQCVFEIPANSAVKQNLLTESAVLDILGDPDPTTSVFAVTDALFTTELITEQEKPSRSTEKFAVAVPPPPSTKTCANCERDIDSRYHICPHCKTYLVDKL